MAPCRLAKARQRLKRAVSHQRCQGGALVAMGGCPRHLACAASGVTALVPYDAWPPPTSCFCGAEQRFDQRAERQPPHGIHGIFPAPLVTETADTRIVIGLEGCGTTDPVVPLRPSACGRSYGRSSCYVNLQEKKKTLPLSGTLPRQ